MALGRLAALAAAVALACAPNADQCEAIDPDAYALTWQQRDSLGPVPCVAPPLDCTELPRGSQDCDLFVAAHCAGYITVYERLWRRGSGLRGEAWIFGGPLAHACDATYDLTGAPKQ